MYPPQLYKASFQGNYSPYRNSVNIVFLFQNVFNDIISDWNFAHAYNISPPNIHLHVWTFKIGK